MSVKKTQPLTLSQLRKTNFIKYYSKLFLKSNLTPEEIKILLSLTIIFINQDDIYIRRLGYRTALLYARKTKDYIPLYDIAINQGIIPVAKSLSDNYLTSDNDTFIKTLSDSFADNFIENGITLTQQQSDMNIFLQEIERNDVALVAPTSYGKSNIIIEEIKRNYHGNRCVIVPSKALISQTKNNIIKSYNSKVKVITHPEMYKNHKDNIFVLTQERASKLLSKNKNFHFDLLLIDEAHNILENTPRSKLLANVICRSIFRNKNLKTKYFTPFLNDANNLSLKKIEQKIESFKINEYVKSEIIYLYDFRSQSKNFQRYDQFLDKWTDIKKTTDDYIELIKDKSLKKNIIYFNSPKRLEDFAKEFARTLTDITCDIVEKACSELSENVDENYLVIRCLKKGIVYHHGSMTDNVRLYIETVFKNSRNIKYLITNSTLLEGVNLPVERLFILENKKGRKSLNHSQFNNLVGRINRFGDIFIDNKPIEMGKLLPQIFIVGTDLYSGKKPNFVDFIKKVSKVDSKRNDQVNNVLLKETEINEYNIEDFNNSMDNLENLEQGIVQGYNGEYVETEIGKILYENNVSEINIHEHEYEIEKQINHYRHSNELITDEKILIQLISNLFINKIKDGDKYNELSRLKNVDAQNFYAMFLSWKIKNTPFKLIIRNFLNYWDSIPENTERELVFVGKWGDETFGNSHRQHWVNINKKTRSEKINIAIVRIKEEDDFLDYQIFKFIEVLNEINLIDEEFYLKLKYGTINKKVISLVNDGFSRSLSELIISKYNNYFTLSESGDITLSKKIIKAMMNNNESEILMLETKLNIGE
ncbi:DEAD/DEAH box helicase [Escherichia coli]|uniref:DEAD/DEAH box helicase n=1 Tax=Escherichia coli TaxID=562 RepID=UPI0013652183|nr:DEAD/DEAH box helicase [Escherichia coli]EIA5651137.1 DEAD/DEAH box helicase [Escherichia coli]MWS94188.1 DEAD/DEAH box helicase [Escherichia coli]HAH3587394.1 RNA helicase [Escherichia coli]HAW1750518.1 DEAD/DEAH box helicase [Escherichia coli]HBA5261746.1 DEAD/DEAH box helicase [Escherichia coli]